jgi:pimeloyl-ACP methyl ester carboxylesterase
METPLLLLWGVQDPWIRPVVADKVQAIYPKTQRVNIEAGHCPHDECKSSNGFSEPRHLLSDISIVW